MYVSATSIRFSAGRSTPAIRATRFLLALLLALLVPRIAGADHADHALATHDLAVLADLLDRCTHLHASAPRPRADRRLGLATCSGRRSVPSTGRRETAPLSPCRRARS